MHKIYNNDVPACIRTNLTLNIHKYPTRNSKDTFKTKNLRLMGEKTKPIISSCRDRIFKI